MEAALRVSTATAVLPAPPLSPEIPGEIPDPALLSPDDVERYARLTDAEYECEHGHLPLDRDPACGCWTPGRVRALLAQEPIEGDRFDTSAFAKAERQSEPTPEPEPNFAKPGGGWRRHNTFARFFDRQPTEEVTVDAPTIPASSNGTGAEAMHAWYMDDAERTIKDVAEHFGLSTYKVNQRFDDANLARKPRGGAHPANGSGSKPAAAPAPAPAPEPKPETPVSSYAAALAELEREREELTTRLPAVNAAIDALKELAA